MLKTQNEIVNNKIYNIQLSLLTFLYNVNLLVEYMIL